jgi:nitrogen regulatory protein P-II 1
MKKIEAIIRKTKFEEVKDALKEIQIEFFSYWDVRGIGKTHEARIYRGVAYDTSTIERTMLTIVVRDKNLEKTINCIMKVAKTGEVGDGKIFVSDLLNSYRIRTGEQGDASLFIKGEEV